MRLDPNLIDMAARELPTDTALLAICNDLTQKEHPNSSADRGAEMLSALVRSDVLGTDGDMAGFAQRMASAQPAGTDRLTTFEIYQRLAKLRALYRGVPEDAPAAIKPLDRPIREFMQSVRESGQITPAPHM